MTIVGLGEDGPDGLSPASQSALAAAEVVFGPARHLGLLDGISAETRVWPVPFAGGLPMLDDLAGKQVVVLASGDPFWFGAGRVLAERYGQEALRTLPSASTFSLAAARLGWGLEETLCLGLHAAPMHQVRRHLSPGQRLIVLLRDGAAVLALCDYLVETGFGPSELTVCEALGGPRERITKATAENLPNGTFNHPVAAGIVVKGDGPALPYTSGLPDDVFAHDGQLTKRHVRALTLAALAPRYGEHLWDIGGGAGSVAIEWCLSHPSTSATVVEMRSDRAARIRENANAIGVDRLDVIEAVAPDGLDRLVSPDAVFIGGGLSADLLAAVKAQTRTGTRLVVNAVTLEGEALLTDRHAADGGELIRIEVAQAEPLGRKRGWKSAYPVVQWSAIL